MSTRFRTLKVLKTVFPTVILLNNYNNLLSLEVSKICYSDLYRTLPTANERIALLFGSFTSEKIKIYYLPLRKLRRFVSKTTPRGPNTKINWLTLPPTNGFRYYWVLWSKLLEGNGCAMPHVAMSHLKM